MGSPEIQGHSVGSANGVWSDDPQDFSDARRVGKDGTGDWQAEVRPRISKKGGKGVGVWHPRVLNFSEDEAPTLCSRDTAKPVAKNLYSNFVRQPMVSPSSPG